MMNKKMVTVNNKNGFFLNLIPFVITQSEVPEVTPLSLKWGRAVCSIQKQIRNFD